MLPLLKAALAAYAIGFRVVAGVLPTPPTPRPQPVVTPVMALLSGQPLAIDWDEWDRSIPCNAYRQVQLDATAPGNVPASAEVLLESVARQCADIQVESA